MKLLTQSLSASLVIFLFAVLAAPRGSAQVRGTVELSPIFGTYFVPQDFRRSTACYLGCQVGQPCPPCVIQREDGTAMAVGGRVTAWVNRRIAVEGSLEYSPSTSSDNLIAGSARVLLGLRRDSRMWIYMAGGPALVSHAYDGSGRPRLGGVVGVGAHCRVARSLALRAELENYFDSMQARPELPVHAERDLFLSLGVSVASRRLGR